MSAFKGRFGYGRFAKTVHCMVWLVIFTLAVPVSFSGMSTGNAAPSGVESWNRHVHERLNGPERAAALAEAARVDAAARDEYARGEEAASSPVIPAASPERHSREGGNPVSSVLAKGDGKESRPKTVTEVLFNGFTGFMGVPGLTPQRDIYGNPDEGLGFHQDGTVRKAGGTASASGPSANGYRARAYMQSGLQNGYGPYGSYGGYGMNGYDAGYGGLYDEMHYDLWGRNDPTRGGRVSGQNGYSRDMSDYDPMSMALDRGLSYGAGLINSMGEAALSGLVDGGRARLNFYLNKDGEFGGEGDALLPFWDSQYSTAFVQLGGRSMSAEDTKDRWIGNLGLGQRWFPGAESLTDSGDWMVGYNAFFDYDFTRSHQRGGVGLEAQYDWLRLATNYYFPLSSWRDSKDFDGDFVKERAAEGWDVRVKGYMPFYRNLAITGAYSQWYGDHVGMFGAANLEKDPKVWSYGLEYTPIPLVSGFVTQRSTERGRSDTEFGLNFTYHFQMPWEDQISHSKVAELRTVSGSRHEFVDRENRIILEYKAKNSYRIEYLGRVGNNAFKFRIADGFGKYRAGQSVTVRAGGGVTLAEAPMPEKSFLARAGDAIVDFFSVSTAHAADFSKTYTSDGNGEFIVRLDDVTTTPVVVTIQAGGNTQTFTLAEAELSTGLSAADATIVNSGSTTLTFSGKGAAFAGASVTWTLVSGPGTLSGQQNTTDGSGVATATLTANSTGSGPIVVRATVNGTNYEVTVTIGAVYALSFPSPATGGGGFVTGSTTAQFTVKLTQNGVAYTTQTQVTWSVVSADNSANQAVVSSYATKATGLAWGDTATSTPGTELTATRTSNTNGSGDASIQLTDIMGDRTVTVRASVTIGGQTVTQDQPVTFGPGPLAAFKLPAEGIASRQWANNMHISSATRLPASELCGGPAVNAAIFQTWTAGNHSAQTSLPTRAQFQAIAGSTGNGAWEAAGWSSSGNSYWTGELDSASKAWGIDMPSGGTVPADIWNVSSVNVMCTR